MRARASHLGMLHAEGVRVAVVLLVVAFVLPVRADRDPMQIFSAWARGRPELREGVPHAVWSIRLNETWRLERGCVERLEALGVQAHRLPWTPTPAPDIVVVERVTGGVEYSKKRTDAPLAMACALAARLPRWSASLREQGVHRVEVLSAYRRDPAVSFHHLGLALDVTRMWDDEQEHVVERDWVVTDEPTCRATSRPLERIVCATNESRVFNTVITPSYGRGHADHLHVDIRPDDPWFYLR